MWQRSFESLRQQRREVTDVVTEPLFVRGNRGAQRDVTDELWLEGVDGLAETAAASRATTSRQAA